MPESKPAGEIARRAARAQQRLTFCQRRRAGDNIRQSSDTAGVSYATGQRYEKRRREGTMLERTEEEKRTRRDTFLDKLNTLIEGEDTSPRDFMQAIGLYADLEGLKAPQRQELTVQRKSEGVQEWLDSLPQAEVRQLPDPKVEPAPNPAPVPSLPPSNGGKPQCS